MKALVIPDVHLKPYMFRKADILMERGTAENAVCLMDIADDWNQQYFVRECVNASLYNNVDSVVDEINHLRKYEMWNDDSLIWLRPQYANIRMYKPRKILQVVGHTPVDMIKKKGNIISCDVFSTYRDGKLIGTEEFLLLDTITWEYQGIKA